MLGIAVAIVTTFTACAVVAIVKEAVLLLAFSKFRDFYGIRIE
jgi:hypothetical protein